MLRDDHDLVNRLEEEDDGFHKLVNVAEDLDINKSIVEINPLSGNTLPLTNCLVLNIKHLQPRPQGHPREIWEARDGLG